MTALERYATALLTAALLLPGAALAQREGVEVGANSGFASLVPAKEIELSAAKQYKTLLAEAASKNALAPPEHPQLQRLRRIADQLIPFANEWNPRAKSWQWEVNLIGS